MYPAGGMGLASRGFGDHAGNATLFANPYISCDSGFGLGKTCWRSTRLTDPRLYGYSDDAAGHVL